MIEETPTAERPIAQVRGTRDWLPADFARLASLERLLLDRFTLAGYEPMRTPVLELIELHERKSGAGIVSKLYELANSRAARLCLRPELTASIVRAYTAAEAAPELPWRVSMSGPAFRYETPAPGRDREFQQVGVELLGASGPEADGEVIGLAEWTLREAGIHDATLRIGHVGLILEMLDRSGLPPAARSALVEMLSEAAAEGRNVRALESALDQLAGWLRPGEVDELPPSVGSTDDGGVDRLFRHLVPDVTGRRSGHEIIGRLRRKWDLGHTLHDVLRRVRDSVHELAELRGPVADVFGRLRDYRSLAPESVAALEALLGTIGAYRIEESRVEIDLGFGRGIGFYSQMIFELIAPTPDGPREVCGGGRYDGLARVFGSDRDDRGVGFAFGLERLMQVLDARGVGPTGHHSGGFLVQVVEGFEPNEATALAVRLRNLGARAVLETRRTGPEAAAHAVALGLDQVVSRVETKSPSPWKVLDPISGKVAQMSDDDLDGLARIETGGRGR